MDKQKIYADTAEWLASTFVDKEEAGVEIDWYSPTDWIKLNEEIADVLVGASGNYRAVIFDTDVVYKLVFGGKYQCSNRTEWDNYHDLPEPLKPMFAKPLYLSEDGSVLVMERIKHGSAYEHNPHCMDRHDVADIYTKQFAACGISADDANRWLWDVRRSNFGFRENGSVVMFDYASYP